MGKPKLLQRFVGLPLDVDKEAEEVVVLIELKEVILYVVGKECKGLLEEDDARALFLEMF